MNCDIEETILSSNILNGIIKKMYVYIIFFLCRFYNSSELPDHFDRNNTNVRYKILKIYGLYIKILFLMALALENNQNSVYILSPNE